MAGGPQATKAVAASSRIRVFWSAVISVGIVASSLMRAKALTAASMAPISSSYRSPHP